MRIKDWSVSAVTAGFLAVLVSYSGPLLIFYQAAMVANVPHDVIASWVWGISIGAGVAGVLLSWLFRAPVVTAWSAPGTALLVTLFPETTLNEAVGAYLTAAAILFAIGISGSFDKLIRLIPRGIAFGMMAGILFPFGVKAFQAAGNVPLLAFGMIGAYVVCKRFFPRYVLVLVLLVGIALAVAGGKTQLGNVHLQFTTPQFIAPEWTLSSIFSLAIPLVLVSLTGQFLPGMAILNSAGYNVPARPIFATTSMMSAIVALSGGITITIAAITAALCTGSDAHENPGKRYVAGIANGIFYLVGGCFAGSIVLLFTALPIAFVAILAGLALVGAIMSNLMGVVGEASHREASIITFLVTASGMTFHGLGSAFWGVVIGLFAYAILHHPWGTEAAVP